MKSMIALTFLTAMLLATVSGCSTKREVPTLEGLDLKTATARLQERGLQLGQVDKEFAGNKNSGTVLRQVPGPGVKVALGTPINLTVEDSINMPNLIGLDLDSATRTLTNQGLRVQRVERKFVGGATSGAVVSQEPPAGSRVPAQGTANLIVDDFVVVPDFTSESYDAVRKLVTQLGLTLGKKSFSKSESNPDGTILSQFPDGGTKVPRDTAIQFELASARVSTGNTVGPDQTVPAKAEAVDIASTLGGVAGDAINKVVKKGVDDLIKKFPGNNEKKTKDKKAQPQSDASGKSTGTKPATTNLWVLLKNQ